MPRILVVCAALLATACGFDASYGGGHYLCSDGMCPTDERCVAGACTTSSATDAPRAIDSTPAAALTCSDPGTLAITGGTIDGATTGRSSQVSAICSGEIMNGPDAVYQLAVVAGATVHVAIAGDYAVAAYAIAPCAATPATPSCEGNLAAQPGAPIAITTTSAGAQFIVVDGVSPAFAGTYTLTVTVDPP